MSLLPTFSFWPLLVYLAMAQFWLAFFSILVPNALNSVFIASYGAARLVEKKCASYTSKLSFKYITIDPLISWLDAIAYLFASLSDLFGRFFHSYEVHGIENIPEDKPALIIYYHGVLPADMQYLPVRYFLKKGRVIRTVADRFLFCLPIWRLMVRNYIFPGPPQKCIETLKDGHLLQISPGGTREALFATLKYETIWNHRAGFARVAKKSGVVIIPVFTRNIRQMFYIPEVFQRLLRPLYERVRVPVVPLFGGFPVKLITYIGEPIPCDSADTAEELADFTRQAIEKMITTHQTFPATIRAAISERFEGKSHLN